MGDNLSFIPIAPDNHYLPSPFPPPLFKLTTAVLEEAKKYSGTTNDERRQLELLLLKGGVPSDLEQQRRLSTLVGKMVGIYSTAKFNGMSLEPEITEVMATSRNYTELLEAYLGWRQVTGPLIKPLYAEFVNLLNVGAQEIGYKDAGKLWRSNYDMDSQEFASLVEQVWQQVLPLYEELHCFTRSTLIKEYGKQYFDEKDGYIPGHLLGNPWAQDFSNIYNLMTPVSYILWERRETERGSRVE